MSKKKRDRESARYEKTSPKPSARPATYCTRCGQGLAAAADIPQHDHDVHLGGGR